MGVRVAAANENPTKSVSLPKFRSIFTAETHAIRLALNTIKTINRRKVFDLTDSQYCLQDLKKTKTFKSKNAWKKIYYSRPTEIRNNRAILLDTLPCRYDGEQNCSLKRQGGVKTARRIDSVSQSNHSSIY